MVEIREELIASDYHQRKMARSKIDPAREIVVEEWYNCPRPRCRGRLDLVHGVTFVCKCGLVATRHGNNLECVING